MIITTGNVRNQAIRILRTVSGWRFFTPLLATILPATPEESTCVVLTGHPKLDDKPMVIAAAASALAPWAYVRCSLPIFSPTVLTIRFHPIMVPKPSEREMRIITHRGE